MLYVLARQDAGSMPSAMGDFIKFMLAQVELHSKLPWNALAEGPVAKAVWQKAVDFRSLFNTGKIREHRHAKELYHICKGRSDSHSTNVIDRPDVSAAEAAEACAMHANLRAGAPVAYDALQKYTSVRIFWHASGKDFCTCRAFPAQRRCFHVLALALRAGREPLPPEHDVTPLSTGLRGRRRRAGDRYSVQGEPPAPARAEKNQLMERLQQMKDLPPKQQYVLKRPASAADAPLTVARRRRLVCKTPTADAPAQDVSITITVGQSPPKVIKVPYGTSVADAVAFIAAACNHEVSDSFVVKDQDITQKRQLAGCSFTEGLQWHAFDTDTLLTEDRRVVAMPRLRGG